MKYAYFTLLLLVLASCRQDKQIEEQVTDKPDHPNIILLIGDGMGLSQMSAAYFFGKDEPSFSRFPVIGLIKTNASSHKITDSGAGATAFSTGKKTYNGGIGVGPDSLPLKNITEHLAGHDYGCGIIATCRVTHATPAAFFAHSIDRDRETAIAAQLHTSPLQFVAAGGYGYFMQEGVNYLDSLQRNEFILDTSGFRYPENIKRSDKLVYLHGLHDLPSIAKGRGPFSEKAFAAASSYFSERAGPFFLMIEGSQIDWAGHENDTKYLIEELVDFEKVVKAALDFAEKDKNTLVVVLADHETGGFTLGGPEDDQNTIVPAFSVPGHSATLIPVLAYGPGSDVFSGIYDNTDIFQKLMKLASD